MNTMIFRRYAARHELKGDRKGTWSVIVQANWCITFYFAAGDADDVAYEDYH